MLGLKEMVGFAIAKYINTRWRSPEICSIHFLHSALLTRMNRDDPDASTEGWGYVLLEKLSKPITDPERNSQ